MKLYYDESGYSDRMFNGNISAYKISYPGMGGQSALSYIYDFDYNRRGMLTSAMYKLDGETWWSMKYEVNNLNYDPNGNILSLTRRNEADVIENDFSYAYNQTDNRLLSVKQDTAQG